MTTSPGERRGGLPGSPGDAGDVGNPSGASAHEPAAEAAAPQPAPDAATQPSVSGAATQPSAPGAATQPSASGAAGVPDAPVPGAPGDRPLSRRELREQERRRTAVVPDGAAAAAPSPVVASLAALARRVPSRPSAARPAVEPRSPGPGVADVAGPHPGPEHDHEDLAPHEEYRYTWRHLGVLAAVAGVLGFLIWSQTTADGSGADGARAADPTTSSSLTTTRGEP